MQSLLGEKIRTFLTIAMSFKHKGDGGIFRVQSYPIIWENLEICNFQRYFDQINLVDN